MKTLLNNTLGVIVIGRAISKDSESPEITEVVLAPGVATEVPDDVLEHPAVKAGLKPANDDAKPIFKAGTAAKKGENAEAAAALKAGTAAKA